MKFAPLLASMLKYGAEGDPITWLYDMLSKVTTTT